MSIPALTKQKEIYIELIVLVASFIVLLFSSINISSYLSQKKVLGVSTSILNTTDPGKDKKFWDDFLAKNPNYIQGWVEIGMLNKAKEIDPNYLIAPNP